jgi:hypothetical protein
LSGDSFCGGIQLLLGGIHASERNGKRRHADLSTAPRNFFSIVSACTFR